MNRSQGQAGQSQGQGGGEPSSEYIQREFGIIPRFPDQNTSQAGHLTQGVQPVDRSDGSVSFHGQSDEATERVIEEPSSGESMETDYQQQFVLGSTVQEPLTSASNRSVAECGDSDATMYVAFRSLCFDIFERNIDFGNLA